jgi:hypothetical protein
VVQPRPCHSVTFGTHVARWIRGIPT